MIRRGIALGVGVIVLILIVLGIKSCVDSQHTDALKTYNRQVSTLVHESDKLVSQPFFQLLQQPQQSQSFDLQAQVNQLRVVAQEEVQRAESLDVPGSMEAAQRDLLLTLNLRAGGLEQIGNKLPQALGRQDADAAIRDIAGQMEVFLGSDVVYSQRVAPLIQQSLDDAGIEGQTIAASQFLPRIDWLDASYVASQLGQSLHSGRNGQPTPGTHGHGLTSVSVGGQTLTPGSVAHISIGTSPVFDVQFENQGENDEVDVKVRVKVEPTDGTGSPITVTRTVAQTTAGETAEAMVQLGKTPPIGVPVEITVSVLPVPGEGTTSNNSQTYNAIFTQ